jgi:cyclohexanecarboxylate-CoA ligase
MALDTAPADHIPATGHLARWKERILVDYLDEAIEKNPERVAIVHYEYGSGARQDLTFSELGRRVDQIAWNLIGLGVERGDAVSVQLPNWWHFIAVHLACLRIGAVTNPLMPIFRERELKFMLGLAESKVLIVPKLFRDTDHELMIERVLPSLPALKHVIVAGSDAANGFDRMLLNTPAPPDAAGIFGSRRPDVDDVVQLLYTSGTTGEPKGVMHTSRTLLRNMLPSIDRLQLGQDDPILSATPLAHQLGFILGVIVPVVVASSVVMQDVWSAPVALERIREHNVTFAMGATPFLADLIDHAAKAGDAGSLRTFLSAGAPIPRQLVKRAREEIGFKVLSAYGMTENLLVSSTRPDDPEQKVFETDGIPTVGIELRVVSLEGKILAIGEAGKLLTRGTSLFVGYLKRPELYNVDKEGWFDTGDLARLDADGYVTITGRWKDVIIRGGENIPVVEIENVLYRHPAVRQVAIVAMPDARLGERCCAFAVLRDETTLGFLSMQEFLEQSGVARSYWPERLELVDTLPMTASGKIQKFVLRDMAREFVKTQDQRGGAVIVGGSGEMPAEQQS